jgi:hypothetical protein
VQLCSSNPDPAWDVTEYKKLLQPLYDSLKVPITDATLKVSKISGGLIGQGGQQCTCDSASSVDIKLSGGAVTAQSAAAVDSYLSKIRPGATDVGLLKKFTAQCVFDSSTTFKNNNPSCKSPSGAVLGAANPAAPICKTWELCDDAIDAPWVVAKFNAAVSSCLTAAKLGQPESSFISFSALPAGSDTAGCTKCANPGKGTVKVPATAANSAALPALDLCLQQAVKVLKLMTHCAEKADYTLC